MNYALASLLVSVAFSIDSSASCKRAFNNADAAAGLILPFGDPFSTLSSSSEFTYRQFCPKPPNSNMSTERRTSMESDDQGGGIRKKPYPWQVSLTPPVVPSNYYPSY